MSDDYLNEQLIRLDELEKDLEDICKKIAETSFLVNSSDFDFYNKTDYVANKLRELAYALQNKNEEICEILDMCFDATAEYPKTKHYGI